ncbi:F-box/LRR-repeat protein 12-like [Acipenser ruthenus]|uniref:F-box/LRR-repeat protein 12-like n=1 Tax=Acipenser ruthenus TaxID=7906 RepID=UPI0027414FB5|nr:F-box/LRR-repeat protein 12-like [Acipenser ruthenus]
MEGPESLSLNYLPENILIDILSCLGVRDLLRISRVCKKWRRIVQDKKLWVHVDLSGYSMVSSKVLWLLLRRYLGSGLLSLSLRGQLGSLRKQGLLSPALLRALSQRCPRLRLLSLTQEDLKGLGSHHQLPASLRALGMCRCEVPPLFFRAAPQGSVRTGLETLVLRNVPSFCDSHLKSLASQVSLKTLVLSGTYRVTDLGIGDSAESLAQLSRLELHGCGVSETVLHFVGRHMRKLRALQLSGLPSLTGAGLGCISQLPELETLSLERCRGNGEGEGLLNPEVIVAACRPLPALRTLRLSQSDFGGPEAIGKVREGLPGCLVTSAPYPSPLVLTPWGTSR